MKLSLNIKQLNILSKLGIYIDPDKDYDDDELFDMEEAVADYLQLHGISDGELNDVGKLCESIIDILVS